MKKVIVLLISFSFFMNCENKKNENIIDNSKIIESNPFSRETDIEGFKIKTGYVKYDKSKSPFKNPAFIQILKDNKLIYSNSFTAYDELYVDSKGFHNLAGNKLVFTINYGGEACDFNQGIRYYSIDQNNKVFFLKEFSSQFTDYASLSIESIFPKDKNGAKNCLKIVENLSYNESNESSVIDTSIFSFSNNKIDFKKLSNNIKIK
jgi:hypothetical protein